MLDHSRWTTVVVGCGDTRAGDVSAALHVDLKRTIAKSWPGPLIFIADNAGVDELHTCCACSDDATAAWDCWDSLRYS